MVMVNDHAVLRGLSLNGSRIPVVSTPPLLVARTEKNFVAGLLKDLGAGSTALSDPGVATRNSNSVTVLYQPVHYVFNLAVLQVNCDSFGGPRLDPAKIDSMGLVVRRISTDQPGVTERWSKQGSAIVGWVPCPDSDLDPDPARRRALASTGNAYIDQHLPLPSPAYAPYTESVAPLFAAPPGLCSDIKATVLYGVIPVTSSEKSETFPPPQYDPATVAAHLPFFLQTRASNQKSQAMTLANQQITYTVATDTITSSNPGTNQSKVPDALLSFMNILRQFEFELNAFSDTDSTGMVLFQALNQFSVHDADRHVLAQLGDFMKTASQVLIDKNDGSGSQTLQFQMPNAWPDIPDAQCNAIAALVQKAMEARVSNLISGEGRYENTASRYVVRAFIRVKRPDGCPPQLIWCALSDPFLIAPWYDNAGLPPVKIVLPSLGDLRKLKPNVAFAMPEDLFNELQRDGKKIVKGEPTTKGGMSLGLMWICGFNIPVITICAFIVLNIFLSLFDLFLHWMFFIKICLPIPIPKKNNG